MLVPVYNYNGARQSATQRSLCCKSRQMSEPKPNHHEPAAIDSYSFVLRWMTSVAFAHRQQLGPRLRVCGWVVAVVVCAHPIKQIMFPAQLHGLFMFEIVI